MEEMKESSSSKAIDISRRMNQAKHSLDLDSISSKTIEAFLRFLGLEPDYPKQLLDLKLNPNMVIAT